MKLGQVAEVTAYEALKRDYIALLDKFDDVCRTRNLLKVTCHTAVTMYAKTRGYAYVLLALLAASVAGNIVQFLGR